MLNYYNHIDPTTPIQQPAMPAMPNLYGKYGASQAFSDNDTSQAAAVSLDRARTQMQNQYYNQAASSRDAGALQGLQLTEESRQDAMKRAMAMQQAFRSRLLSGLTQ